MIRNTFKILKDIKKLESTKPKNKQEKIENKLMLYDFYFFKYL